MKSILVLYQKLIKYVKIWRFILQKNSIIDSSTTIWKYTYIWYWCSITKSSIWNYCSIANNVLIWWGEHDVNRISLNSIFYDNQRETLTKWDVTIWNDVWIWNWVIVRRWVKIWNGAVIWANSFVNKDIPPYGIAVWTPAKVIKYRFDKKKIQAIEKSKRWEYDPKNAKMIFKSIYENE